MFLAAKEMSLVAYSASSTEIEQPWQTWRAQQNEDGDAIDLGWISLLRKRIHVVKGLIIFLILVVTTILFFAALWFWHWAQLNVQNFVIGVFQTHVQGNSVEATWSPETPG